MVSACFSHTQTVRSVVANPIALSACLPDRKSYYRGLHDGLKTAILEGKKRAEATASTEERSQSQIVLVDTAAAIDRYMGEQYGKFRKRRCDNPPVAAVTRPWKRPSLPTWSLWFVCVFFRFTPPRFKVRAVVWKKLDGSLVLTSWDTI